MIEAGVDAWLNCRADPQSPNGRREIVSAIWQAMATVKRAEHPPSAEIARLWQAGKSVRAIAEATGWQPGTVYGHATRVLGLPKRGTRGPPPRIQTLVLEAFAERPQWTVDEMLGACVRRDASLTRKQIGAVLNVLCRTGRLDVVGHRGGRGGVAIYRLTSAGRADRP